MKIVKLISMLLLGASGVEQTAQTKLAFKNLRRAHPAIQWNSKSVAVADVNCDGMRESILLGKDKTNVVIAVISGSRQDKIQLLTFPINSGQQDGFCAMPTRLEISPLDCESDEGHLPGCRPEKACKEFAVLDDECDASRFYWDASRKALAWWRH